MQPFFKMAETSFPFLTCFVVSQYFFRYQKSVKNVSGVSEKLCTPYLPAYGQGHTSFGGTKGLGPGLANSACENENLLTHNPRG